MALFVVTGMAVPALAASDFPNRTVRILVGFAPGGTTDLLARIVADELRSKWNTAVVIENWPGADGIVATTAVHNAPADGYTLLMSTNALVITPHLKPLPYNPIKDFEPITIVGQEYHHLLVTPKLPVKTVKEFIDLAKSTPGGLTFSQPGRAAPRSSACSASCKRRNDEHGPRPLSRLDAGRPGAGHSGRSVDVFVTVDDVAAVERRQDPRACGFGPKARPERARRANPGGVGSAGIRKQHLVRAGGVCPRFRRTSWTRSARTSLGPCALLWCSSASTTSNRSRSATPRKNSAR